MESKEIDHNVEVVDVDATSENAPHVEKNPSDKAKDYFRKGMQDAAKKQRNMLLNSNKK